MASDSDFTPRRQPDAHIAQALQIHEHVPEAFIEPSQTFRSWLWMAAGSDRQHGGNDGYDDQPDSHYSWDHTVPNHRLPKAGDAVVLWDKKTILGASVIEVVERGEGSKVRYRCPDCKSTTFETRKRRKPTYRCQCGLEFEVPSKESMLVRTYRSRHDAGWVDLYGALSAAELRPLAVNPKDQFALRPLDWSKFVAAIAAVRPDARITPLAARIDGLAGHTLASVRVRIGQAGFRARLLERFGAVCAITGPAPPEAIEAAHLYQYAEIGKHHPSGGLPLRRDVHRLFDLGLIAVDPESQLIDVAPELSTFEHYADFHGKPLQIKLDVGQIRWLALHWEEHRLDLAPTARA